MMKLAWLTDIHLNFLEQESRELFYQNVLKTACNAVLISGDIAEAPSVAKLLTEMVLAIKKPIYFVLGNHDYYRGQVEAVRNEMISLTQNEKLLHWLPASGPQILAKDIVLLGQDGWADGRLGDYKNSRVILNDSRLIQDLHHQKILGKYKLLEKMQQFADHDAKLLEQDLEKVILEEHPKEIIVLTHVPPFREACLYEGKQSDDEWVPFFASKATGDVVTKAAQENPGITFLVLCGHTHGKAYHQPLENLIVKVGHAEYFQPEVQEIIRNDTLGPQ